MSRPGEGEDELLAAAGETESAMDDAVPRCPNCGKPTDDIDEMTDEEVATALTSELGKDLLRDLRRGLLTHQEKSIARAWLKDNSVAIKKDNPEDEDPAWMQGGKASRRVQRKPYPPPVHDDYSPDTETNGG